MKSNFSFTFKTFEFINGNQSDEPKRAREIAEEIKAFVEGQLNYIKSYQQLENIITNSDEVALLDALTAINYINSVMIKVESIHENSKLRQFFKPMYKFVADSHEDATEIVKEVRQSIVR
ncbi:hypothetical protein AN392_01151 [Pseudoalteromonas sp. P1-16-1b]|uniref:hypothetical protein n=1 Tax=Pseudoalteromonas sp. P1-16-1b TaxID=1723757 RepID=UPI0006D65D46|nr:hypothetical protein [Pseudoalteromonas sp. P1-16-1b]KPZ65603.1 hypothetical protein AN392_01151 [Pseudoalteromonas sp. P1-16-1b]